MTFLDALATIDLAQINKTDQSQVRAVLQKERLSYNDFLCLLSPAAAEMLEELAKRSSDLTLKFFGKTMLLYAPLYLSNECDNNCVYCGFSQTIKEERLSLSLEAVCQEAEAIYSRGFRHLLLVSGEKRAKVSLKYLEDVVRNLHDKFESIGLEIFPLSEAEYQVLAQAGADSLTIYQEVYDQEIYNAVHPAGAKANYQYRLQTPERAGRAGFFRLNIGTLLGLGPWQREAAALGLHAEYLMKKFWRSQVAVSFPRLKSSAAHYQPPNSVSDQQMVQMICALRIFKPSLGLVLSTREDQALRDNLIPLGITQMSAESKTSPGAYIKLGAKEQFAVADQRSLPQVMAIIKAKGYEPVLKDWDKKYI